MILLKNVNIKGENIQDVLIENQMIKQIAKPNTIKAPDAQTFDLTGKIFLPGLVDLHCWFKWRTACRTFCNGSIQSKCKNF